MIDLRASRPLTGDDLAAVAAAEALILPLLGHYLLRFLLSCDPPLPFLQLLGWRLVLQNRNSHRLIDCIYAVALFDSLLIIKYRRTKRTATDQVQTNNNE